MVAALYFLFVIRTCFLYDIVYEVGNMLETTYTNLREELASYMDRVTNDREIVVVKRKGDQRVAIIPADELAGLIETAHLLRSPKNAERLMKALQQAQRRKGKPESLDKLRQEMGLGRPR